MALTTGVTNQYTQEQNFLNLERFLKGRGYGIASYEGPVDSMKGNPFDIHDPSQMVKLGRIFKERRILLIGSVRSAKEAGKFEVEAYGKKYFEKLKRDLQDYPSLSNTDISLLLASEEPRFDFPNRSPEAY